ncbi:DEBR0S3_02784g1_1 [Brettanomyces bruxellensis]|uniref:DNA-binding protein RAP1 n=1 Tax=Dekkera bruxellensis TaxID=5007 RepID=A0A7D9GZJ2_DEKBR|nr:DEBR0S3_02784g1_1 [Brettanomyces bruxellensis]
MSSLTASNDDQLFVGPDGTSYIFYLCPPLNTNDLLIKMIEEHGGGVTYDLEHTCIVISVPGNVPDELRSAHIYSYKVIEDSVREGIQQEFGRYLIHNPEVEDIVQGEVDENGNTVIGAPDEGDMRSGSHLEDDNGFNTETNDLQVLPSTISASLATAVFPRRHGIKYFTPEEDAFLLEEIRKRPWLGFRGHQIYKEIAAMDFFRKRGRSYSSLRERIRTLKYHVGYVYKATKDHKLLVDENGNYVRTYLIKGRTTSFTAADDFALTKVIYQKLNPSEKPNGFETVLFPTNFFDKFCHIFVQHTSESWRQRFKNYLVIFGIKNYLKYYIVQKKQGLDPQPSNLANKEWMRARRELRKADNALRLYFPNIPMGNKFIDDNIDMIEVPELEGKNLEVFTPVIISSNSNDSDEEPVRKKQHTSNNQPHQIESYDPELKEEPKTKPEQIIAFVDVPTTSFREKTFVRSYKKYGEPMDLKSIVASKPAFYAKLDSVFSQGSLSPKQLSFELRKIGIKEYYTVFLMHRCNSNRQLVKKSICHFIETNGHELLCIGPGAWSNKALSWLDKQNEHLNTLLKKYHGEENFESELRSLRRTKSISW